MKAQKIKLGGSVSISTSIVLMVIGAFLIKYRSMIISSLVFLLAVTVAVVGLAMMVRKFRYHRDDQELYVGLLMLIIGSVVAIFTEDIAQYGLVAIGGLFAIYGLVLIINHASRKSWFYMSLGMIRLLIGTALIVLALTNAGSVQSTFALLMGIVSLTVGLVFLVLEK